MQCADPRVSSISGFVTPAGAALEDHLQLSSMRVQPLAGVLLGGLMSEVATQRGVAAMIGW